MITGVPKASHSSNDGGVPKASLSPNDDRVPKASLLSNNDRVPKASLLHLSCHDDRVPKASHSSNDGGVPKASLSPNNDGVPKASHSSNDDARRTSDLGALASSVVDFPNGRMTGVESVAHDGEDKLPNGIRCGSSGAMLLAFHLMSFVPMSFLLFLDLGYLLGAFADACAQLLRKIGAIAEDGVCWLNYLDLPNAGLGTSLSSTMSYRTLLVFELLWKVITNSYCRWLIGLDFLFFGVCFHPLWVVTEDEVYRCCRLVMCLQIRVRGRPIEANCEVTVRNLVTRHGDGDLSRLLGALSNILDGFQKRQNIAAVGGAAEHNSEQFSLGARHVGFSLATKWLGVLSNLSAWCTQLEALILYKCMDFDSHGRFYCAGG
ncbi:unnamed protein product [Prunus brigantina]